MKRWSIAIFGLLFCATVAFTQESAPAQKLFSSDLVAWSFMQQPHAPEQGQPRQQPEPTPETQPSQNPTPAQPQERQTRPGTPESQVPTAQTFTGTISKESDSYVLKVSSSTFYKLDNEQQVQPYEGRRVQITGTLDRSLNLIHVEKIEPMS